MIPATEYLKRRRALLKQLDAEGGSSPAFLRGVKSSLFVLK